MRFERNTITRFSPTSCVVSRHTDVVVGAHSQTSDVPPNSSYIIESCNRVCSERCILSIFNSILVDVLAIDLRNAIVDDTRFSGERAVGIHLRMQRACQWGLSRQTTSKNGKSRIGSSQVVLRTFFRGHITCRYCQLRTFIVIEISNNRAQSILFITSSNVSIPGRSAHTSIVISLYSYFVSLICSNTQYSHKRSIVSISRRIFYTTDPFSQVNTGIVGSPSIRRLIPQINTISFDF